MLVPFPPRRAQKFPPPHSKGRPLNHVGQVLFYLNTGRLVMVGIRR
jgi:hypothetical protein